MPFFKIHEVPKEFFYLFLKGAVKKKIVGDSLNEHPMLMLTMHTGETSEVLVRYYKRSGDKSVEDTRSYFPCLSIQDYPPEVNKQLLWGKDFVEGIVDEVNSMRELVTLPIPLTYKFQVSAVTNRLKEAQGISDWFFERFSFQRPDCFEFNSIDTEEGIVADIVPYTVGFGEVPRDDGKFEYVYDFSLKTYLHARHKKRVILEDGTIVDNGNFVDCIKSLKYSLSLMDYGRVRKELVSNFSLGITTPISNSNIGLPEMDSYSQWDGIKW